MAEPASWQPLVRGIRTRRRESFWSHVDLDELINQTIRRASELGYSLQELRSLALERLRAQPPDHILVVEHEPELRQVICAEISSRIGKRVESCTEDQLSAIARAGARVSSRFSRTSSDFDKPVAFSQASLHRSRICRRSGAFGFHPRACQTFGHWRRVDQQELS